jgi:dihydropteroate synthase
MKLDAIPLPCVMGILNVTPDSFSDGGKFFSAEKVDGVAACGHLRTMIADGASIVDIGGESTNPMAQSVDPATEWDRIGTVLAMAVGMGGAVVSVDSYHPETAKLALENGADIINDVCCTWHFEEIAEIVKKFDAHLIVTHNSRNDANFLRIADPIGVIAAEFEDILRRASAIGLDGRRIILDPGIGFGKTAEQNCKIFKNIRIICRKFPNPVICAVSKKSFLKFATGMNDGVSLSAATVAATAEGFRSGCKIFRVHAVSENVAALEFAKKIGEQ